MFPKNFYPHFFHRPRQCMVEMATGNLVSKIPATGELFGKLESAYIAASKKNGSGFYDVLLLLHRFKQTSFFEKIHTPGQKAFSNDKTGKIFFFNDTRH